nr:WAP four-disulfide core domain 2 [Myotis myotis]
MRMKGDNAFTQRALKARLLPQGGLTLDPARPLPGPVPGGQRVSRPDEMLPQWLREGVLRHTRLLSFSHHSLRNEGVGVSTWPRLTPAQLPSLLSGLCTPSCADHSFFFQPIK